VEGRADQWKEYNGLRRGRFEKNIQGAIESQRAVTRSIGREEEGLKSTVYKIQEESRSGKKVGGQLE